MSAKPICLCPPASEYDPPCPEHGVVGIGGLSSQGAAPLIRPKDPGAPMPDAETIAFAAEILARRRARAERRATQETVPAVMARFNGVAYPVGTALWRAESAGPRFDGYIAGVCTTDKARVTTRQTPNGPARSFKNARGEDRVALGQQSGVYPSWRLAMAAVIANWEHERESLAGRLARVEDKIRALRATAAPNEEPAK